MNTNSVRFFKENSVENSGKSSELILAVWKASNAENIGKIIRLAHNVGALQLLFILGEEQHRLSKIKKTAGFSFEQQNWKFISEEEFEREVLADYSLTVLETCNGAKDLFTASIPERTVLLAGSESKGIPTHIIEKSSLQLYIPMPGECKSMNVSNALSVAAFEWFRQQTYQGGIKY